MADRSPFTIEIVQFGDDHGPSVVLDRVIGGSVHFDEAKRIGHHLLSIAEIETKPRGFRILGEDSQVVYRWSSG